MTKIHDFNRSKNQEIILLKLKGILTWDYFLVNVQSRDYFMSYT